jgi:hypothetical protein
MLDFFSETHLSKLYQAGFLGDKTTTARKFKAEKDSKHYVKKIGIRTCINLQLLKIILFAFFMIILFIRSSFCYKLFCLHTKSTNI